MKLITKDMENTPTGTVNDPRNPIYIDDAIECRQCIGDECEDCNGTGEVEEAEYDADDYNER